MSPLRVQPRSAHVAEDALLAEDAILREAEALAKESLPSVTVAAVRDIYGASFTAKRDEAFELAAVMIGEPELAKLAPIHLASEEAIRMVEEKLAGLPEELAALEASNTAKAGEAERIAAQIAERKSQLEAKHARRSGFGNVLAALGVVAPPSPEKTAEKMAQVFAGDEPLFALERSLSKLEIERIQIQTKLIRSRTPRPMIDAQLAELRSAAAKLYDALAIDPPPARGNAQLQAADAEARLLRREALLENLEAQAELLAGLKDEAASLGLELDSLLEQLRGAAKALRAMIERAELELVALIGEAGIARRGDQSSRLLAG